MQHYVCGFLISPDRGRVLLIRKNRPAWQAGKLNGVGGKVEPGEAPRAAMAREFREEAGLDLPESAWSHVVMLTGRDGDWAGHFFRAFGGIDAAQAMTDEPLEIHPVDALPPDTIPNLRWIIPMLLDDLVAAGEYLVRVHTPADA